VTRQVDAAARIEAHALVLEAQTLRDRAARIQATERETTARGQHAMPRER